MSALEHAGSWLVTYLIHSTLLIGGVWAICRIGARRAWPSMAVQDVLWKVALVGGVVTATAQVGLGVNPWSGALDISRHETAPAASAAIAGHGDGAARLAAPAPVVTAPAPARLPAARSHAGEPVGEPTPVRIREILPAPAEVDTILAAGPVDDAERDGVMLGATDRETPGSGFGVLTIAALLAAIGAILLLLCLAIHWVELHRRLAGRRPIVRGGLREVLDGLLRRAGVGTRLHLSSSCQTTVPLALGLRRREICVPERVAAELTAEQQETLLAHEAAHLVRRDPAWRMAASVIESVLFFQPLNRLAHRRLEAVSEYLCDDWAVEQTRQPLALARCLTVVAGWIADGEPAPVPAMANRRSALGQRVRRLVDRKPRARARTRPALAAAAFVLPALVIAAPGARALAPSVTPPAAVPWLASVSDHSPEVGVPFAMPPAGHEATHTERCDDHGVIPIDGAAPVGPGAPAEPYPLLLPWDPQAAEASGCASCADCGHAGGCGECDCEVELDFDLDLDEVIDPEALAELEQLEGLEGLEALEGLEQLEGLHGLEQLQGLAGLMDPEDLADLQALGGLLAQAPGVALDPEELEELARLGELAGREALAAMQDLDIDVEVAEDGTRVRIVIDGVPVEIELDADGQPVHGNAGWSQAGRDAARAQRDAARAQRDAARAQRHAARQQRRAAARARAEALREGAAARAEGLREAAEARAEALRAAAEERAEALREAAEERAEALREAAEARREALEEAAEERREALEAAARARAAARGHVHDHDHHHHHDAVDADAIREAVREARRAHGQAAREIQRARAELARELGELEREAARAQGEAAAEARRAATVLERELARMNQRLQHAEQGASRVRVRGASRPDARAIERAVRDATRRYRAEVRRILEDAERAGHEVDLDFDIDLDFDWDQE